MSGSPAPARDRVLPLDPLLRRQLGPELRVDHAQAVRDLGDVRGRRRRGVPRDRLGDESARPALGTAERSPGRRGPAVRRPAGSGSRKRIPAISTLRFAMPVPPGLRTDGRRCRRAVATGGRPRPGCRRRAHRRRRATEPPVADDHLARDDDVAHRPGADAEDPVGGEGRRRRSAWAPDSGGRPGPPGRPVRVGRAAVRRRPRRPRARPRPVVRAASPARSRRRPRAGGAYATRPSSNMSAPMPSVPSATRSPRAASGARPTPLFMFDRALWTTVAPAPRTMSISAASRWTPWARSARSSRTPAAASRAGHASTEAILRVPLIGGVLGDVDVDPDPVAPGRVRRRPASVSVGQRERRVRPDHPAGEGRTPWATAAAGTGRSRRVRREPRPARRGRSSRSTGRSGCRARPARRRRCRATRRPRAGEA